MKVCKKCGERYEDDKKFCKKCGGQLESTNGQQEQPVRHGDTARAQTPSRQSNAPGKGKKVWVVLALILLGAAALGGGGLAVYKLQEQKVEEVRKETQREKERKEREEKKQEREEKKKVQEEEAQAREEEKKEQAQAELEKKEQAKKEEELQKELKRKEEELQKAQEQQRQAEQQAIAAQSSGKFADERSSVSPSNPWDATLQDAEARAEAISMSGADRMAVEQDIYNVWDSLLNDLWQELRAALPEGQMAALTDEQVAWIQNKEAMLNDYWGGDSSQEAYRNGPAANMTRERVYYLRTLLPY